MARLPEPRPGLVIGYAFLWREEAERGIEEGRKDRPCVIVLAVREIGLQTHVTVAPITHAAPARPEFAIEIPLVTKQRLGLDTERAWIVAAELNRFVWPGVDLRPTARGSQTFAYGLLPGSLFRALRDRVLSLARAGRLATTRRSD